MPTNVLLPKWGMGMNDGTVVKWLKQEGDAVAEGDPLCEIESAKVNSEVESPGAGTLARIVVPEGMTVDTGVLLAVILAAGEEAKDLPEPLSSASSVTPPPARNVAVAGGISAANRPAGRKESAAGRRQVTPIARKIARELGVDLETVEGTGPGGRIQEEDVRAAAAAPVGTTNSHAAEDGPPIAETIPLRGLRATIARRMTESGAIPTVTLTTEADVTETVAMQRQLVGEWRAHRLRPQFQDLVLSATARALADHPRLNAHFGGDEIRIIAEVNLGFAVAMPEGLIVPVIHGADKMTTLDIARRVRDVMSRVKSNELHVDDMRHASFSVTNLGSVDVDAFDPLLDPPQIGILGVGRVVQKPAVVAGEIVPRSMCFLSLTFDHRAVDGYPAGELLRAIGRNLADPGWMAS
ncbi:MAG: dihydrolipoamide acetyltransferase family protein [Chloroflexi bacterium]|nr:dihydrolipoamide acetyltransferase family protein [Chloroflexota bacterium]